MALDVGSIVEGRVSGIAKFGAFVDLPEKKVGLVHISEISDAYVNDVNEFLKVRDVVRVKIISVDAKGKIALSMKQAKAEEQKETKETVPAPVEKREAERAPVRDMPRKPAYGAGRKPMSGSFEDKLSRFLKDSDERLLDLKRNTESKRGGRGARRAD